MTTIAFLLIIVSALAVLVRYARHDHFAGPANTVDLRDELGSLALRGRVASRR